MIDKSLGLVHLNYGEGMVNTNNDFFVKFDLIQVNITADKIKAYIMKHWDAAWKFV